MIIQHCDPPSLLFCNVISLLKHCEWTTSTKDELLVLQDPSQRVYCPTAGDICCPHSGHHFLHIVWAFPNVHYFTWMWHSLNLISFFVFFKYVTYCMKSPIITAECLCFLLSTQSFSPFAWYLFLSCAVAIYI